MSNVTLYDAAGLVIGTVDATGRRTMLREEAPPKPREPLTLGQRAMRVANLYRVKPALFDDYTMDLGANRSTARQADAETRRRMNAALSSRDVAVY